MSGMEPLDALIHSMTGIATGGMSSKAQNIGYWYFQGAQMILPASLIVMILGAQNFRDLYLLLKMRLKEFAKSLEVQGFFTILLLLLTLTIALTKLFRLDTVLAIYHLISGYTTTGFQVGNISTYPDALKTIIILAMIIGGATFSTAGGIKIRRIVIALKVIVWDIQRVVMPKNIIVVRRLGREVIDEASVDSTMSYIMLYAITLLLLSVGLHLVLITSNLTNYSFLDSVFEATSALSCVGLSVGITSASLPPTAKIILITAMYLGRLEFLPLYLSIGLYYMKKKLPG
jgi:trk system potassium uptake protein TrkH